MSVPSKALYSKTRGTQLPENPIFLSSSSDADTEQVTAGYFATAEKLLGDTSRGNKLGDEAGDKVVQTVTSETPDREMTFSGSSRPENVPTAVARTRLCVGAEWVVDKTRTITKMSKLRK